MRKTILAIIAAILIFRPLMLRLMPELHENEYMLRLIASWSDYIIYAVCFIAGIIFAAGAIREKKNIYAAKRLIIFTSAFFGLSLISLAYSADTDMSVKALLSYSALFIFMYIVSHNVQSKEEEVRQFTNLFIGLCALIAVYAIWQYFYLYNYIKSHISELSTPEMTRSGRWDLVMQMVELRRIGGTFGSPNLFAGFLGLGIPISISMSFYGKLQSRMIYIALTAIMSIAMLFTFSIGGWISLIIAAIIEICLLTGIAVKGRPKKIAITAILIIAVAAVSVVMIKKRANPITGGAMEARAGYLKSAVSDLKDNYLKGTGIGTFPIVYIKYKLPGLQYETMHAHNSYIEIFSEIGVLGFCAFLGLILSIIACAFSLIKRLEGYDRFLAAGISFGIITFLIHNVLEFTFFAPEVSIFWYFLIGLLFALFYARPHNEIKAKVLKIHKGALAACLLAMVAALIMTVDFAIADIYFYRGVELSRAGELDEAILNLGKAARMNPKDVRYAKELYYAYYLRNGNIPPKHIN